VGAATASFYNSCSSVKFVSSIRVRPWFMPAPIENKSWTRIAADLARLKPSVLSRLAYEFGGRHKLNTESTKVTERTR
jgi:hypothetical protein